MRGSTREHNAPATARGLLPTARKVTSDGTGSPPHCKKSDPSSSFFVFPTRLYSFKPRGVLWDVCRPALRRQAGDVTSAHSTGKKGKRQLVTSDSELIAPALLASTTLFRAHSLKQAQLRQAPVSPHRHDGQPLSCSSRSSKHDLVKLRLAPTDMMGNTFRAPLTETSTTSSSSG